MKKRFYIAGRYQEPGRELREKLQALGYEVKATWLDAEDFGTGKPYGGPERMQAALNCHFDVNDCNELIMFAGEGVRGGRHVELGMALGQNKLCHVIGEAENVFHSHPFVRLYKSVDQFIGSLI